MQNQPNGTHGYTPGGEPFGVSKVHSLVAHGRSRRGGGPEASINPPPAPTQATATTKQQFCSCGICRTPGKPGVPPSGFRVYVNRPLTSYLS